MEILIFFLASIGLTLIIVESKIFAKPKMWIRTLAAFLAKQRKEISWTARLVQFFLYLINCYQCMGFWSGVLMAWFLEIHDWSHIALGFGVSFLSTMSAGLLNALDRLSKL